MTLHLFGHNSKNLVKVGDKVKAYDGWIGKIGNAGGKYYAHLHRSKSKGLTPEQLKSYVIGWERKKVLEHYEEPKDDRDRMFSHPVDNGEAGYGWLESIGGMGDHPGIDYNGYGGGNSDYGYKFKSPVDGEVIRVENWGSGWGEVIIIKENEMSSKEYNCKSDLDKSLKKVWPKFDDNSGSSHKTMAGKLDAYIEEKETLVSDAERMEERIGELKKRPIMTPEIEKKLKAGEEAIKIIEALVNFKV